LIRYCKKKDITIGLHTSYEAGIDPSLANAEKVKVKAIITRYTFFNI